jgi:hypothetical protein
MSFNGRGPPIDHWPESDKSAWECATLSAGLLDPGGPASHLAEATRDDTS